MKVRRFACLLTNVFGEKITQSTVMVGNQEMTKNEMVLLRKIKIEKSSESLLQFMCCSYIWFATLNVFVCVV
jgi:hypothetical protein